MSSIRTMVFGHLISGSKIWIFHFVVCFLFKKNPIGLNFNNSNLQIPNIYQAISNIRVYFSTKTNL